MKIECLERNSLKATDPKLAADEKVKSARIFCRKHSTTSNGIDEDCSKVGRQEKKVNTIGEDESLIRLKKLRPEQPTPIPLPDEDGEEDEEEGGGSISVAMLHPMRIDSGFLCKKHRTEESFPRELIYFGGI